MEKGMFDELMSSVQEMDAIVKEKNRRHVLLNILSRKLRRFASAWDSPKISSL